MGESNLARANRRWVSFSGVLLFCGMRVFKRLGVELAELVEISPRSLEKMDLSKVWLKINMKGPVGVPSVSSARGEFQLGVGVLRLVEASVRVTKICAVSEYNLLDSDYEKTPVKTGLSEACNSRRYSVVGEGSGIFKLMTQTGVGWGVFNSA